MWRKFRILILLLILLFVALNTYFDRVYSTDWDIPLRVTVYPLNGDGSAEVEQFINGLNADRFQGMEKFFQAEAVRYGVSLERPIRFKAAPKLQQLPPTLDRKANVFGIMSWSLRMRYWVWRTPDPPGAAPDIKLFVMYYDPAISPTLAHSVGMQKGLYGVVNVFATREMLGSNDVITAHELLHTLGSIDKYDPRTSQPINPIGYADPARQPLLPQTRAELMGGRIPISATEAETPESLRKVIIGPLTAAEIGWSK
jgi:hypothetical protein